MPWEKNFDPSIQHFYCFIQSFLFYFMKYNIVTYTEEKSVKKEIISNVNKAEWSPIQSVIMRVITKFRQSHNKSPIYLSQVPLQTEIGYQKVLLPINHKNYNFWEKNKQVMKEREDLHSKTDKGGVNCVMVVISWFSLQIWMWLVDSNYNLESDWLIELSDKKEV